MKNQTDNILDVIMLKGYSIILYILWYLASAKLQTYIMKVDLFYYFILLISRFSSFSYDASLIASLYLCNRYMPLWKFNAANFLSVCFTHGRPHSFILVSTCNKLQLYSHQRGTYSFYKPVLFNLSCYGHGLTIAESNIEAKI